MSGGGDEQRRVAMDVDPAPQLSIDPRALVISDPSALKHGGEDPLHRQGMQHGIYSQRADPLANHSKKLQDDLHELSQKIKHHELNIKYLKSSKNNLEESILQMQENDDLTHMKGEEETTKHFLGHEKSAAALLCSLKRQAAEMSSDHSLTKDIIGIVATLGKVDDDNLSRLLSEYLGQETMLAVVCKTQEGVKALETYNKDSSIDKSSGIHAFAASIGAPLADRFHVICLEDLRPYAGEFINCDPQRQLSLLNPRLPNGETPPGFLGFAVNMITMDSTNLCCVYNNGHSLRETLFYNLFSNLQVYKSKEAMMNAASCIRNGAISLDGGMIRGSGIFTLGHRVGDVAIKFSNELKKLNLTESYFARQNLMKEATWKKDRASEDMKREQALLENAESLYESKKGELLHCLAGISPHFSQHPAGRVSTTPR